MKTLITLLLTIITLFIMQEVIPQDKTGFIDKKTISTVKQSLIDKYGEKARFRIERGVEQAANLWRESDGTKQEFISFCSENFAGNDSDLGALFQRVEYYNETLTGYYTEMTLGLKQYLDLDWGEIQPIDLKMGGFDPAAHLTEDLFSNKFAFRVVLNFPKYSLNEKISLGNNWSRLEWAYARLGNRFQTRIPAEINQKVTEIYTDADHYISEYNIFMGSLIDGDMKTYFPSELKLISHWGLRDELKAHYGNASELPKQKMIYEVMKRIINQDIPSSVINSNKYQWNPYVNKIFDNGKEITFTSEPDTRYAKLLSVFKAAQSVDPYYPDLNTHILRSFESEREVAEKDVEKIFEELLTSPQVKKVADLIKKRLGRELEPFDVWYTGFKSRLNINEEELDKITKAKYPTPEAFEKDIINILLKLGFPQSDAEYISEKIAVDPARGSGHAFGTAMRKFKSHLRTRVMKDGMNYKGYNIAVHELGHNVEQTLTLYKMDYYSLNGVPNTSFTEAFAFLFQRRDMELLGMKSDDAQAKDFGILDNFWDAYEIMGVSLVDMKVWNWMYRNPTATPAELKAAVVSIAKDVWNKYYADVFGKKDELILGIYSHMIDAGLYLPNYSIGHLIEFQIEEYLKDKPLGPEMMRMCASGNIIPQQWMKNAVGMEISAKPMLKAVDEVMERMK
jgi:hypothetical protein